MELKILNPQDTAIKAIEWNYEEIKEEVSAKVAHYKSLVYSDDQINEAKKDKATLNKFIDALENKRKEVKKACLAPYETFEKQIKDVTAIVTESVNAINSQVTAFEDQKKEKKLEEVKKLFATIGFQPFIKFEQIYNTKWLNVTATTKQIEEEMKSRMYQIGADVTTLSNLPEYSFEALEMYKTTLNLNIAINEAQRIAEVAKRKAELERQIAEAEARANNVTIEAEPAETEEPAEVKREWVNFSAWLSKDEAIALGQFVKSNNITIKRS